MIQLIPTLDYPGNDALRAKRASSLFGGAALAAAMMVVWFSLWWLNTRSVAPQLKRHLGTGGGSRRECVCASALLRSSARLARSTHTHVSLSLSTRPRLTHIRLSALLGGKGDDEEDEEVEWDGDASSGSAARRGGSSSENS